MITCILFFYFIFRILSALFSTFYRTLFADIYSTFCTFCAHTYVIFDFNFRCHSRVFFFSVLPPSIFLSMLLVLYLCHGQDKAVSLSTACLPRLQCMAGLFAHLKRK